MGKLVTLVVLGLIFYYFIRPHVDLGPWFTRSSEPQQVKAPGSNEYLTRQTLGVAPPPVQNPASAKPARPGAPAGMPAGADVERRFREVESELGKSATPSARPRSRP